MAEETKTEPKKTGPTITYLAQTNFRHQKTKFGIKKDDRRRHLYLIGKTGMGKSTVMENMIVQDIQRGRGVALVDPHGDFAEKIINFIPPERINDVVYFNPADIQYPIAFNVMESVSQEHKHLIASGLVGVFKKLWADSWGPRLEYILRNAILALLDYPGSTLLGVNRMFVDKTYRNKVVAKIQDPVVKAFWIDEYSRYSAQFAVEAVASIQNKIGQFLSTALIRNVVGQVKSTIDIRKMMDEQKILIMNLSKGRIGEDASALLGAMMITKIQLAAMSRIDLPEEKRKDFYLYVDEFQNFATESFAAILSEARKYRLNLIIGHQYIEQLSEEVRAAVFGNVGTIMCFRIGAGDAEFLTQEFAPYFEPEDLVNLSKYDVYMKLMIDGVASTPFSASTLPPLVDFSKSEGNAEKIIKVSRERYSKPRDVVEDKISRWSGMSDEDIEQRDKPDRNKTSYTASSSRDQKDNKRNKKDNKRKNTFTANCYECGKTTEITFKPGGVRPIYCTLCFQKIREGALRGQEVVNLKEEPKNSQPEISLEQALEMRPTDFDSKPSKNSNPPSDNHRPELKEKTPETPHQKTKSIEPGQIVKF